MIQIPHILVGQFTALIVQKGVSHRNHPYYVKWLRYYLDFCHRYGFNQHDKSSLPPFIEKLQEKKQAEHLRKQAHHAVTLFLAMQSGSGTVFPSKINLAKSFTDNKEGDASSSLASRKTVLNQPIKSVTVKEAKSPLDF